MKIMNGEAEEKIREGVINMILQGKYELAISNISNTIDELHAAIPDNKRVSYGIVYTITVLSEHLYTHFVKTNAPVYQIASQIFERSDDPNVRGVALGMLSYYGLGDYAKVLTYFESAAASHDWHLREYAQTFFRKLIKRHPFEIKEYLLKLVKSQDPNIRRFVSEALRPVRENTWFYQNPDYPLSILKTLFRENASYPRASVGNNLSDLSRHLPDLVYGIIRELVASEDENSYWIAHRACRNMVKKQPDKVMDILNIDEYKYKKTIYKKSEHQEN